MKKSLIVFMGIGIFICMIDTTIMNVALPVIQTEMNTNLEMVSWSLNIYTIIFAVFTIPFSKLSDIYGKYKIYFLGLILFLLGSILCASSNSIIFLIFSRAVQSLGAAILFPISMAIAIENTEMNKRKKVIAILGMIQGLSAALGPLVGGIILQYWNWRYIFWINIPFILLSIFYIFPKCKKQKEIIKLKNELDYSGTLLLMISLFSLTLLLIKINDFGVFSIKSILLFIFFVLTFILFIYIEKRNSNPLIQVTLFKDKKFASASFLLFIINFLLTGLMAILPTLLNNVENRSILESSLFIAPIALMIFFFSPISGIIYEKIGIWKIIFIGFLLIVGSYWLLSFGNLENINLIILTSLLMGSGFGLIVAPATIQAASNFEGENLTASQSIISVVQKIGIVLAVSIFVGNLTINIDNAKFEVIKYADKQVEKLEIPDQNKKVIKLQIKTQIINQQQNKSNDELSKKIKNMAIKKIEKAYNKTYQLILSFIVIILIIYLMKGVK